MVSSLTYKSKDYGVLLEVALFVLSTILAM